jgi:hypothetical protein
VDIDEGIRSPIDKTVVRKAIGDVAAAGDAELPKDAADVGINRPFRDTKFGSNLRIR